MPAVAGSVGALTIAQQSTPPSHLGRLVGTLDATASAGMAVGSLAAGVLVDRVPLGALLNVQAGAPPVGWRVRGGRDAAPNQSDKVSAAPAAGRRAA